MGNYICAQCQTGFVRPNSGDRQHRFCSQKCYHAWRAENDVTTGQFSPGIIPWNKGVYMRHSPATEFKKGQPSARKEPIGTVKIRTRKRDGKQRAWVKVADPNVWRLRSVVAWEARYGVLPEGLILHHQDRDTLNDSLDNLAALSRAGHLKEHRREFKRKRKR